MKHEYYTCDQCGQGLPDKFSEGHSLFLPIGPQIDQPGNRPEDIIIEKQICIECLVKGIQKYLGNNYGRVNEFLSWFNFK